MSNMLLIHRLTFLSLVLALLLTATNPTLAQNQDMQIGELIEREKRDEDACHAHKKTENGCVTYTISKKYRPIIEEILADKNSAIPSEITQLFNTLHFRGFYLGMQADEVLELAHKQKLSCSTYLPLFYRRSHVVIGPVIGANPDVSVKSITCLPNGYFLFSPLGRLHAIGFDFVSDKKAPEIVSGIKKRHPEKGWGLNCKSDNNCDVGSYIYRGQDLKIEFPRTEYVESIKLKIDFDNTNKVTVNNIAGFKYSVSINADWLEFQDFNRIRKALE